MAQQDGGLKPSLLRDLIKPRFMEMMSTFRQEANAPWRVMIVDQNTSRIVSSVCSLDDVFGEGIALLRMLEEERDPYPQMEAIYFISPTSSSIDILISDFAKKQPLYADIHLFFASRLPDPLFKKLVDSEEVAIRIKTLTEVNIDFLAIESQAFHFDAPPALLGEILTTRKGVQPLVNKIADKLLTVCLTLQEYPAIRFGTTHPISAMVAGVLQHKLDLHPQKPAVRLKDNKPSTTLVIIDRTIDLIAPILHEFTYQAMIYDLLEIDPYTHKYTFQNGEDKKDTLLREQSGFLFCDLRHKHIAEVSSYLDEVLKKFVASNKKLVNVNKGESLPSDLKVLAEVAKKLPQFQDLKEQISLHLELANKVSSICCESSDAIKHAASLEQDIATEKWLKFNRKAKLLARLINLLSDRDLSSQLKLRLLLLWIIVQKGGNPNERSRLLKEANLSQKDQNILEIIAQFIQTTVVYVRSKSEKKRNKLRDVLKKPVRDKNEDTYELSRYITTVKEIMLQAASGNLNNSMFPYVKEEYAAIAAEAEKTQQAANKPLSLSSPFSHSDNATPIPQVPRRTHEPVFAKRDFRSAKEKEDAASADGRILIFVVGGMTFSELRSAYEVTEKTHKQVFIGSTSILTPKMFLESIQTLEV